MVTIVVCVGSACHLKGSYDVISNLQSLIAEKGLDEQVEIKAAFCFGECVQAVSVKFEGEDQIHSVQPKSVKEFFANEVLPRVQK